MTESLQQPASFTFRPIGWVRSPYARRAVELLRVEGRQVSVRALDILDGTPRCSTSSLTCPT